MKNSKIHAVQAVTQKSPTRRIGSGAKKLMGKVMKLQTIQSVSILAILSILEASCSSAKCTTNMAVPYSQSHQINSASWQKFIEKRLSNQSAKIGRVKNYYIFGEINDSILWGLADAKFEVLQDSSLNKNISSTSPGEKVYELYKTSKSDLMAFSPAYARIDNIFLIQHEPYNFDSVAFVHKMTDVTKKYEKWAVVDKTIIHELCYKSFGSLSERFFRYKYAFSPIDFGCQLNVDTLPCNN